ncbi:uncharacterized protein LOC125177935 [Hyalella azteca]|uniref:Uncharacterized protein LOC125177935 n=1 Tax=Hyalella azteca TaxID=294128 RepID=A0A979FI45_HYAAZ|nr:uncharacterized protein LOC125177935 [Hyalella azteca]
MSPSAIPRRKYRRPELSGADLRQALGSGSHLEAITARCETSYCHQGACQAAVQALYNGLMELHQDLALRIGLCVCRPGEGLNATDCVRSQRRLHPHCAEQTDALSVSQCHRIGRVCRNDKVCRILWANPCVVESQLTYHLDQLGAGVELISTRLEAAGHYDPDHPSIPRVELPSIFGEDPEATNASPSESPLDPIDPAPQLPRQTGIEFHPPRFVQVDHAPGLVHGPDMRFDSTHTRGFDRSFDRNLGGDDDSIGRVKYIDTTNDRKVIVPTNLGGPERKYDRLGSVFGSRNNRIQARKVDAGTLGMGNEIAGENTEGVQKSGMWGQVVSTQYPGTQSYPPSDETTTIPTTIVSTTRQPTTTLPEKYCQVDRDSRSHILEEGKSIRLYPDGNKDCSELCSCDYGLKTLCTVLKCVEERPCEAKFALFHHNAPAFQAYRGRCVCYSGDFICMRPPPEEYSLPPGLFLLLGFSREEEALLRNVTQEGAIDALQDLRELLRTTSRAMGDECFLELYANTSDNLVLQVRHLRLYSRNPPNETYTLLMLQQERKKCEPPASAIARQINDRDEDIHHHVGLSLFVLAEVTDNVPNAIRSTASHVTSHVQHSTLRFVRYLGRSLEAQGTKTSAKALTVKASNFWPPCWIL